MLIRCLLPSCLHFGIVFTSVTAATTAAIMAFADTPSPPPLPRARIRRGAPPGKNRLRPRAENARERDTLHNLYSWIDVHHPAAIHCNAFAADNDKPPEPCRDPALAAFAQLCALRLNVRRVLATLLSANVEFVLADASCTMSLQHNIAEESKDELWLGTCSFPRDCGINNLAVDAWHKARRWREPPSDPDFYYLEGRSDHYCIVSTSKEIPPRVSETFPDL